MCTIYICIFRVATIFSCFKWNCYMLINIIIYVHIIMLAYNKLVSCLSKLYLSLIYLYIFILFYISLLIHSFHVHTHMFVCVYLFVHILLILNNDFESNNNLNSI